MTFPVKYTRLFDYLGYQNANPTRPLPGVRVNADLNDLKRVTSETIDFLSGSFTATGALNPAAFADIVVNGASTVLAAASASAAAAAASAVTSGSSATTAGVSATSASASAASAAASATAVSPGGRLTLASGVQVMAASYAAQATVYYTPDQHNQVRLYNGSVPVATTFTETSQTTTDNTKSPAAVAANKNYDMFVWSDSGTVRCTRGPAWSSDTVRGTGAGTTELVFNSNGLLLNANAITNGPAAQRGTYVGTIRSNGSSLIDFIFGAAGSGGVAAVFGVWNMYNRERFVTRVTDNGISYAYVTATIRQARGSAGNQVSFVRGMAEGGVLASIGQGVTTTAVAGAIGQIGMALDSTTTFDPGPNGAFVYSATAAVTAGFTAQTAQYNPGIGWHTITRNELGDGANANAFGTGGYIGVDLTQ